MAEDIISDNDLIVQEVDGSPAQPVVTDPPVVDTVIEDTPPQDPPVVDPPVEDTPPADPVTPTPPPVIDWAKYGMVDESDLATLIEEHKAIKPIAEQFNKAKPLLDLLPDIENPFADGEIAVLNGLKKAGITNMGVASAIASFDKEAYKEDPLTVIALAEIASDPELASMGLDRYRRVVAKREGVNDQEWADLDQDTKDLLLVKAVKSTKELTSVKEKFGNQANIFQTLQKQRDENANRLTERRGKWDSVVPKLSKSVSVIAEKYVDKELGEIAVSVAISEDEAKQALSELIPYFAGGELTDDAVKNLQLAAITRLRSAKQAQVTAKMVDAVKAQVRKEAIKQQHNAGPVARQQAPAAKIPDGDMTADDYVKHITGGK